MPNSSLKDAEEENRKAIALDPTCALPHCNLGDILKEHGQLKEAEAEFRKAIAVDPKNAEFHNVLGTILAQMDRGEEAETELRKAIALDPRKATSHLNLGIVLKEKGQLKQAEVEYRQASALDPRNASPHFQLGQLLQQLGQLEKAVVEFRATIKLDPRDAQAHYCLGRLLLQQGKYSDAEASTRRALELLPPANPLRGPASQQLERCQKLPALEQKLAGILEGKAQPESPSERLQLAQLCQQPHQRRYALSARLYAEAFAAEPKLANDFAQHRYNAACSAALAGCGQGTDAADLTEDERARLRRRSLVGLRAELEILRRLLEKQPDKGPPVVVQNLGHWQEDADFAGVRGEEALAKLPEEERQAWRQLWADVANTLTRAREKTAPEQKPQKNP